MKRDKHLKVKEKICDALMGKKWEIVWREEMELTTSVFAETEEEAYDKWDNGEHPEPRVNNGQVLDDSLEVFEIK